MAKSEIRRTKPSSPRIKSSNDFSTRPDFRIHLYVVFLLIFFTVFFASFSSAKAQETPTFVVLASSKNTIDLWPNLTILSDSNNTFSIGDVLKNQYQFRALTSPYANLGMRADTVWLRTHIAVPENAPVDWHLRVDYIFLDEIDLYVVKQGQPLQHLSYRQNQAFSQRSFEFHGPTFQLVLQSSEQYELVIRVRKSIASAMIFPVSLDRTDYLVKDEVSMQFWRGLMLGVGTYFVVYALFIAALKRDLLCLWFALFAATSTMYAAAYYGLASEHLWPNSSIFPSNATARYCQMLRIISCFLFIDGVLNLRQRSPRVSWLLKALAGSFILLILLFANNLASINLIARTFTVIGTLPLLLFMFFVVSRVQDKDPLWNWAIAGTACYAIGIAIASALHYGYLPWSRWTESAEHLGALLNMAAWGVVMSIRSHRRQRATEISAERERRIVAQLAVDLKHQKEIAEEISLSKSRFLAAASHDLRQPMHALSLFIGALRSVPMNAKGEGLVAQIEASTDAMDRLFAALLNISKLDAGVVEVVRQPFAIDVVLRRVCDDHAEEASAKGLTLTYVPCRATISSDPMLVERIARNLISNAVRYTNTGRIVVGCRRRGWSVVMQVFDTGRGIPPDQQELVFQEYYQVENSERDREKGLGLGLAIVQRLANLLGCDLCLRSEPGRGSCFEISLPRTSEKAIPLIEPVDRAYVAQTTGFVVVIDDEKAIRIGMLTLLADWGYKVLAAGSAKEAIQLLADCAMKPDLVISDLRLRDGESGIEAIEKIRIEYNEPIPAILITGDTASNLLLEVQNSELPILHKPVPNGKLRAAITHLIIKNTKQQ